MSVDVEELRRKLEHRRTVFGWDKQCEDLKSCLDAIESLRAENAELREKLGEYDDECHRLLETLASERDALRWRPVSEPPEDEEEYVEVVDERLSIELRPWWTVAVDLEEGNHSWTHYRRFVAPGEA